MDSCVEGSFEGLGTARCQQEASAWIWQCRQVRAPVNRDDMTWSRERRGRLEVHVHEGPGQPVLISKKALTALGVMLDFEDS